MAIIVAGISVVQGYVLARSATAVSCPVDTNEDTLATIIVPAGALGINGVLRVMPRFTITNSANNKTLRFKFGGTNFWAPILTTQLTVAPFIQLSNRGVANSQISNVIDGTSGLGQSTSAFVTAAIDTASAVTILLTGQKATASETITLESYIIELFPTA